MVTKAEIQSVRALRQRAQREQAGIFVVEGWKGVMELLASNLAVVRIYVRSELNRPDGVHLPDSAEPVSSKDMERMSQMKTPPGILATVRIPEPPPLPHRAQHRPLLVCDRIADPGNLGTLIRTADWFGFAGVVCDVKGVDPWNSKCLQAAMGSAFRLPIWNVELAEWFVSFEGTSWALDAGGEPLDQIPALPAALIVGSESHGLSAELREAATHIAAIPGHTATESLNAAVAGSIAMYQINQSRTAS
jgi:TrmH family RNA methyltransferase